MTANVHLSGNRRQVVSRTVPATYRAIAELTTDDALHVQVWFKHVVVCARLLDYVVGEGDRRDVWRVDADVFGRVFVSPANARLCGGTDGRCHCAVAGRAGERQRARPAGNGAGAAPLGKTGVTA